jgi:CheY-like chemotaxis protein
LKPRESCLTIRGVGTKWSPPDIPPEVRGALVLVVNDEPYQRVFFTNILSTVGFATETLGDGAAAVERRFQDPVPAAIVMNWLMPVMTGTEAIRLIRSREAAESLPRVPIVLESGALPQAIRECADADATLATPFVVDDLFLAVLRAMGRKKLG